MTEDQAVKLANSGWWKGATPEAIVKFQLFKDLLCMDFGDFHQAVEACLGRPVWTHEFGSRGLEQLKKEFLGESGPPSFAEILELIPADKRVIFLDIK